MATSLNLYINVHKCSGQEQIAQQRMEYMCTTQGESTTGQTNEFFKNLFYFSAFRFYLHVYGISILIHPGTHFGSNFTSGSSATFATACQGCNNTIIKENTNTSLYLSSILFISNQNQLYNNAHFSLLQKNMSFPVKSLARSGGMNNRPTRPVQGLRAPIGLGPGRAVCARRRDSRLLPR